MTKEVMQPAKPVAAVSGTYGGRVCVKLLDPALALADGTALYTAPVAQPASQPTAWMTEKDDPTLDKSRAEFWANQMGLTVIPLYTQAAIAQPAMTFDGMSAQEFIGNELFEFQEATGFDTAAEYRAAIAQPVQPAAPVVMDAPELKAWGTPRYGYFDTAGEFVQLPLKYDLEKLPVGAHPKWVGGTYDLQIVRAAALAAARTKPAHSHPDKNWHRTCQACNASIDYSDAEPVARPAAVSWNSLTDAEAEAACKELFGSVFSAKSMDDMIRALTAFAASRTLPVQQGAPAQAVQAAQPLSDEQLEREWTALQARRLKHANEALQTQVGQPCPQCKTGKLHIESNGYNEFMRCQSCRHVPFQWPLQAAITAKTGDSMTDKTSEAFEAWFPFAFDPEFDSMAWKAWQAATLAERERCALVCDSVNNFDNPMTATDCADAIRQGGEA